MHLNLIMQSSHWRGKIDPITYSEIQQLLSRPPDALRSAALHLFPPFVVVSNYFLPLSLIVGLVTLSLPLTNDAAVRTVISFYMWEPAFSLQRH